MQDFPECCQTTDDNNQTPLHIACQTGCLDIVKLLLETEYPSSLEKDFSDLVKNVEYSLVIPVNAEDCDNKTAFFLACEYGYSDIVDYLLNFKVKARMVHAESDVCSQSDRSSEMSDSEFVDHCPFHLKLETDSYNSQISLQPDVSVSYRQSSTQQNYHNSPLYIAVKNRHGRVVSKLIEFGANKDLYVVEKQVKYSVLLKQALDNNDLLMLDRLLENGVQDVNNYVFEETVRRKPKFIGHFLQYKVGEDKHNPINKVKMKEDFKEAAFSVNSVEDISGSSDYELRFPKEAVTIRWQNLKVLTTVEQSWLVTAARYLNPRIASLNIQIPLFAVTRVNVSHNSLTMVPAPLLQLPSLVTLNVSDNEIMEFPSERNFDLMCDWLEEIIIHHNRLTKIPDYVFLLPKLRNLDASNNQLQQLPAVMWQADYLHTLNVSCNKLEKLPNPLFESKRTESASSLPDSNELQNSGGATDQPYSSMERHVTFHTVKRSCHWAQSLVVSDEEVRNAQNKRKGINTLKLSKNSLTAFPEFLSCACPHLEHLDAQKNQIKALGNLAAYPHGLKTLDLSNNLLENMNEWQFDDLTKKCYCNRRGYVCNIDWSHFLNIDSFYKPSFVIFCDFYWLGCWFGYETGIVFVNQSNLLSICTKNDTFSCCS